jgi:hypothetical protein
MSKWGTTVSQGIKYQHFQVCLIMDPHTSSGRLFLVPEYTQILSSFRDEKVSLKSAVCYIWTQGVEENERKRDC